MALAGGFSAVWLLQTGDLPEQVVRAATVVAAGIFVVATLLTAARTTHRALLAVTTAAVGVGGMLLAFGTSGGELRWWVGYTVGYSARLFRGLWMAGADAGAQSTVGWINAATRFITDFFPAITALQLMGGLGLAGAMYYRVATAPRGRPPGQFTGFGFTDHLGWAAVPSLLILLLPRLEPARLGALNLLLIIGALFALRGLAVAVSGIQLVGGGRGLPIALLMVTAVFLLPLALAGAIILGVIDAGLDLRGRWVKPPTSK